MLAQEVKSELRERIWIALFGKSPQLETLIEHIRNNEVLAADKTFIESIEKFQSSTASIKAWASTANKKELDSMWNTHMISYGSYDYSVDSPNDA
jgi:hypothetical protein